MGLTVHYDWRAKLDASAARKRIRRLHTLAKGLQFDDVSEIFEQYPPDGQFAFESFESEYRRGDVYFERKREDGHKEVVRVPAAHALFFQIDNKGAETATIGLASHPPVVVHREDVIELDDTGVERGRRLNAGSAVEVPTRRRGSYSWHSSCKTQYASNPKLGGEANFLRVHLGLIELLDQIRATGISVRIRDDSSYAKHRNVDRLLKSIRHWNGIVAGFAGQLSDALGPDGINLIAPIKDHPDFEHIEARGIDSIRKLANRQRRRKRK